MLAEGSVRIFATAMVLVVLAMTGCGDDNEAGPTTSDFSQRRKALTERLANQRATKEGAAAKRAASPAAPAEANRPRDFGRARGLRNRSRASGRG